MKKIGAGIYYNKKKGYIIVANAGIKDKYGSTFIIPPLVCDEGSSYKELGSLIYKALQISESTEPLPWETVMTQEEFWTVSGLKTFRQFCKNYSRVSVKKEGDQYILYKWEPERNGYQMDMSFPGKALSAETDEETFGKEVRELLN